MPHRGYDQGANTPQFVYDAGAEYAMSEPKYPDRKTPMPQDPIFQRYYEKFVAALAEEFNDPEYTSFIDGYGLGKWGEGHSVAYNKDDVSAVDENTETVKREVLDWDLKPIPGPRLTALLLPLKSISIILHG